MYTLLLQIYGQVSVSRSQTSFAALGLHSHRGALQKRGQGRDEEADEEMIEAAIFYISSVVY